ncbi:YbaY family lipoprotein [Pseudoxanthomonas putridarboris]|uniref:YbaY family lipoprotein n=1 Tax=Pseudoxanthomonas putridarboris TaxID=752605 RepID=A0ABU9J097_9GAMM
MTRPLLAAACLLALAACQPTPPAPGDAPSGTDPAPAPATASINGRATYLERIAPPPGATLSVQLIDNHLADTPAAVVASAEFKDAKGPPFEFTLPYDPAKLRENGEYGLHAGLRDAAGRLWFVTDTRVPVTPGAAQPVEFRMVRAGAEPAVDAIALTHWQCGDRRIGARFDNAADNVVLDIDGEALTLPQAVSASGARYADAQGNEFWNKGREATLTLAGKPQLDCSHVEEGSPWEQAKARGIAFRAVGNEPGWLVEVGKGEAPALDAELDYGERKLRVERVQATAGGFSGTTADSVAVKLLTRREACNDGMSDATYPASAILTVDDKTYQGCGRFLSE